MVLLVTKAILFLKRGGTGLRQRSIVDTRFRKRQIELDQKKERALRARKQKERRPVRDRKAIAEARPNREKGALSKT